MAQLLGLFSLLKQLMSKETRSFSSLGLNNFLFCILMILSGTGGRPQATFWSTLFFQIVVIVPLLVSFSLDTQNRLPPERVGTWPLADGQRLLFRTVSFALNPLFLLLFFGFLFWVGLAVALIFLTLGFVVHLGVFAFSALNFRSRKSPSLSIFWLPPKVRGIAQQTLWEVTGTLDFWTALLVAVAAALYRWFGKAPDPEAFPMLALLVAIAMSTMAQRMLCLDEGRASLRYRLLPLAGWKVLVTQDLTFLVLLVVMVSPLSLRTGVAFGLVATAVGRYPSLKQRVLQRRWRFVGGDARYGVPQVLLGGFAGIGAARAGLWVLVPAFLFYLGSVFLGELIWRQMRTAKY